MANSKEQIWIISEEAASAMKAAGVSDAEIKHLTRDKLLELFPELKKHYATYTCEERRDFFIGLKGLITEKTFKDNRVQTENLSLLEELNTDLEGVQRFVQVHINLLKEYVENGPSAANGRHVLIPGPTMPRESEERQHAPKPDEHTSSRKAKIPLLSDIVLIPGPTMPRESEERQHAPKPDEQTSSWKAKIPLLSDIAKVKVFSVVSGKTLGCHHTLLDRVKEQGGFQLDLTNDIQDCCVIIVFCPITSRLGTDVKSAMSNVSGDRPVILVMMHHTYDCSYMPPQRPPNDVDMKNMVLCVNVLFHDSEAGGLLKCGLNDQTVHDISAKLLTYRERSPAGKTEPNHRGRRGDYTTGHRSDMPGVGSADKYHD